ncbi:hypothetical protein PMAYCL1PPCAC_13106 [Pristionchus mayeri]|uniref:EF-hand domain-containing protein n=1 Tax=Pristionchus mayeri TaxID=1317129 RepID=A0AAN4ZPX4_9BILA|nr:hypothetical protein PMAYCL1PPCAC_13106 [Pristionchus mayeri]
MLRAAAIAALLALVAAKEHYDLDGDGVVGIDEFAVVSFAEQGLSKGEIGEIVKVADRTADGILARDELQQAKSALERIAKEKGSEWIKDNDSNHDGHLSKEEFQKAVMKKVGLGHKDIADMWKMADKNRDSSISYNEAPMALYLIRTKSILEANKMLEKFDSDHNSRLSEDEAVLMADIAFDVGTEEALDAFERVARNEVEIGSSLMEGLLETMRESAIDNVEERIREVDSDGDGIVSFNELRKRFRKKKSSLLKKLFRKCDVNRDNVLDGPEWVTLTAEVAMLKKRKTKHDKVIHVHPHTSGGFRGAARDEEEFERRRKKREAEEKKEIEEEIIKMSAWDGLLPVREEPKEKEPEIALKNRVDPKFARFSELVVEDE